MRTAWTGIVLGATTLAVLGAAPALAGPPIIAVFDVEARGLPLGAGVLDSLSDYVATRLAESGRYLVVPRAQLRARLVEAKRSTPGGCFNWTCKVDLTLEMAAQKALVAWIVPVGSRCTVTLALVDAAKAAFELHATATGGCSEDGILASLGTALGELTGGGPAQAPAPAPAADRPAARPDVPVGSGKVENGVVLDRGENIVNQVTDQTGFLVIKSDPPGATISLNGRQIGKTPIQVEQAVGRYVVVAEMGRLYHPARQEIQLGTEGQRVTLTLPPAFGRLDVSSEPPGAEVWLDGEPVGLTPWVVDRLPAGTHGLRLEKASHLTYERTLLVEEGRTATIRATLDAEKGLLVVTSANEDGSPCEGNVSVDGKVVGHSPWKGEVIAMHHLVEVACGDREGSANVTIRRNERRDVAVEVGPSPRGPGRIHGLDRFVALRDAATRRDADGEGDGPKGKLAPGDMDARGSCDRNNIQAVVLARTDSFRGCYERQLRDHPRLEGKITVRWTLDPQGQVTGERVLDSTMDNPAVADCVLRAIRFMRFAKPEGGICVVQWPFAFHPE